jgi:D-alanyl-D-alanine dipeptidase
MRCEDVAFHPNFRSLASVPGIAVDLRYASANNFVGRDLYGELNCAWLHRFAADGLQRATEWLHWEAPDLRLLVLDALRPHRVQIQLWDYLDGTDLRQYVADPAIGSIHSFGLALDATLVDAAGREIDMGSGFDEMTELSHPVLEARHLASGALTPGHVKSRELLRKAMTVAGFSGIDNEWWHFEFLPRAEIRRGFVRVE